VDQFFGVGSNTWKKEKEISGNLLPIRQTRRSGEKLKSTNSSPIKKSRSLFNFSADEIALPEQQVDKSSCSNKKGAVSDVSPLADEEDRQKVVTDLKKALSVFGLGNNVIEECKIGPSVYQISVRLSDGSRLSTIEGVLRDIARKMGVDNLRLIETGKPSTVKLEIPRKKREFVSLREVVAACRITPDYSNPTTFPLGLRQSGEPVTCDIREMPHLLIAGATQSGKSSLLDSIIAGLILKAKPNALRLALLDLKCVSFQKYKGIPHLIGDVATNAEDAEKFLGALVQAMEKRKEILSREGVTNIEEFNENSGRRLSYLVIIVDEYGSLVANPGGKHLSHLISLASQGAACGMHLIISTQRPDYRVVDKRIEANIPGRIALKVSSALESRIILGVGGAEKLRGRGDLLYKSSDGIIRAQGCYISSEDVRKLSLK